MRRVTQAIAFLTLSMIVGVGFQNCSTYQADNNPLFDEASSVCIGLACGMDTSLLKLAIANDASVAVHQLSSQPTSCNGNDARCVDIAGYCDDGGFPNNQIWASIAGGSVNVAEFNTGATCVDGRFSTQIVLPAGYDYANVHTLGLTIYGLNASSTDKFSNETSGNHREVYLVSYTP